jgi:hypothetical protein
MALTPDRRPGESDEEGIIFENFSPGNDPTALGGMRFVNGDFRLKDTIGVFNPRSAGTGITEAQHEALDTLVHEVAETSFTKITRVQGQVTNVTVWTTSGMTTKVRESIMTYSGGQISTLVEKQYDLLGVIIVGQTLTHTYTYVGGQVDNINTVET